MSEINSGTVKFVTNLDKNNRSLLTTKKSDAPALNVDCIAKTLHVRLHRKHFCVLETQMMPWHRKERSLLTLRQLNK